MTKQATYHHLSATRKTTNNEERVTHTYKNKKRKMGKPTSKLGRKLTKKMDRVVSRSNDADESANHTTSSSSPSSSTVPSAALPVSIPTDVSMMTRRERMLTSAFAKKEKSQSIKAQKKAVSLRGSDSGSSSGLAKKLSGKKSSATVVEHNGDEDGTAQKKRIGSLLQASKQHPSERRNTSNHASTPGGRSMLKASAAQRHDAFVKELNLFTRVSQMPAFQQDPFAAIETHLDATMSTLKPQTADIGRRPDTMIRRGAPHYPQQNQRFRK